MSGAAKVDLKRQLESHRAPVGRFRILDVPPLRYLMVDGRGDPNDTTAMTPAIKALYPAAYRLKFTSKRELGRDYVVPPLEGLWWADDVGSFTTARDKSAWYWTLMILVPGWIEQDVIDATVGDGVRCQTLDERSCVQTLHVGSFDDEGPVLARMHDSFIPDHGLVMTGRHHEVYLSDRRRTPPERLRTILRQPVRDRPADRSQHPVAIMQP